MISRDFVIWLKGFTEACNDYTATPKQWDRIKEVLENVEDYDDNPGIDVEIDDWHPENPGAFRNDFKLPNLSGTSSGTGSIGFFSTTGTKVWNDQMGCWHYTNYPEGFGYFTNSTAESKKEKKQLND